MDELETIRKWFAYNAQVRRKYFETLGGLPREELDRDRGASYPSMLNILEHTVGAYYYWFQKMSEALTALPRFGSIQDTSESPSLEEVRSFERLVQSQVDTVLSGLTEHDLDLTFRMQRKAGEYSISVRDALWHLVEEELQHRGELNALLWQIDVNPPITGWNQWVEASRAV